MRRVSAQLFFLLLLACLSLSTVRGATPTHDGGAFTSTPEVLIARVTDTQLWTQRHWHALLHYRPRSLGLGYRSEADGAPFFLASDGRDNPRAELLATLAAFFSDEPLPDTQMTAQCTFPARRLWLTQQLGGGAEVFPPQSCDRLNA